MKKSVAEELGVGGKILDGALNGDDVDIFLGPLGIDVVSGISCQRI